MECKHSYFRMIEGELYCIQCGKSAKEVREESHNRGHIEDKIDESGQPKMWPPEVKRETIVVEQKTGKLIRGRSKGSGKGRRKGK